MPRASAFPGFDSSVQGRAEMINLGLTTTINNSTVNDVRLVYLRNRYFGGIPIGGTGVPLNFAGLQYPWNARAQFHRRNCPYQSSAGRSSIFCLQ